MNFVLIDVGCPTEVEATVDKGSIWIETAGIEEALGWQLKPDGLWREDTCIPIDGHPDLVSDRAMNLATLADLLGQPLALSVEESAAYLGPPPALFDQTVGRLAAPDFTLPDLDGRLHSLSEHRGSKVLLAAWASW